MGVLRINKPAVRTIMPGLTPQPSRTPLRALGLKTGRARRALTLLGPNDTKKNLDYIDKLLTISAEQFARKWNFDPIQGKPLPPGRYLWSPVRGGSSTTNSSNAPATNTTTTPNLSASKSDDVSKENEPNSSLELCLKLPRADLHQVFPQTEGTSPRTDAVVSPNAVSQDTAGERPAKEDEEQKEAEQKEAHEQCPCLARSQTTITGSCSLHAREREPVDSAAVTPTQRASPQQQLLRQTKITEFARPKKRLLTYKCDLAQDLEPPRKKLSVRE